MNRYPKVVSPEVSVRRVELARVLLIHGDLASRLALKTILEAGGYSVDAVSTPMEALARLDERRYELVLSDSAVGSRSAARNLLAYARVKEYQPATALITSDAPRGRDFWRTAQQFAVYTRSEE